ncbi:MAG: hypothetical protein Q9191_004367 [Dirinaria sp. TL-2023a]
MSSRGEPESAFTFLPQGALIQEFSVAGHNLVLSLPTAAHYANQNAPYFGETVGRTTNRIRAGQIPNLNGKTYQLATNDAPRPNLLHGGNEGWGKKIWEGPKKVNRKGKEGVEFNYLSKDGDEGYPGTVHASVWYIAGMEDGPGGRRETVLEVEYEVQFIGDECEETVVGVTNHSYFTVNPTAPTVANTHVSLGTNHYLELDSEQIPTGRILPHPSIAAANTQFTLTSTTPSFDDCFVLPLTTDPSEFTSVASSTPLDTRALPLRKLCSLSHPETGLHLEVQSTEPAFQFYTGEGIDIPQLDRADGTKTPAMGARKGIAIEPSRFVNCAGREEWRGMCTMRKGDIWGARSVYRAWKE